MDVNQWHRSHKEKQLKWRLGISWVAMGTLAIVSFVIPNWLHHKAEVKWIAKTARNIEVTPAAASLWYTYYNETYFDRALPQSTVFECQQDVGYDESVMAGTKKPSRVFLVTFYMGLCSNPTYLRATLLHEMIHIELWDSEHDHGPKFQAEITRLDKEGAFSDIWR